MTKLYIYGIGTLLVLGLIGGTIWKWNSMVNQITVLEQDKSTLEQSISKQEKVIAALNQDKESVSKLLEQRTNEINKINSNLVNLSKKISALDDKEAVDWKKTKIPESVLETLKRDN